MKTFAKKPETITAIQWIDTTSYWNICNFLAMDLTYIGAKKLLEIPIANGFIYAEPTDWVVKNADGSVRIVKDTDLLANYDEQVPASNPTTTTGGGTSA